MDTESTPLITPSEVIDHLFCPRFIYYMHCLKIPQHEELRYKVLKGRAIHEKKEKENKEYLRKKIGCIDKEISVYLASPKIKVRGVVDEILYLDDGTLAPLDYKYAEYKDFLFETHKVQSTLYALLIQEIYKKEVKKGFICYVKDNVKLKEVIYTQQDFEYTKEVINDVFRIIDKGFYPKKTKYQAKCVDCCYKNICV
ncbi:MAG: CRISPR-associated protein Cas4 [Candidatus Firestonebacteria bacterium]|nr:CRISPR-associated protein Cas4 [Candidatus Firestonebacteria bacterium]